jgi:hypothetical protein
LKQVLIKSVKRQPAIIEASTIVTVLIVCVTAIIIVFKPGEFLSRARDAKRDTDIKTLGDVISLTIASNPSANIGSAKYIYISLPSSTAPLCDNPNLPIPPSGFTYRCVTSSNVVKVDGTGWIPINFTDAEGKTPISTLPEDSLNDGEFFYQYVSAFGKFAVAGKIESVKYRDAQSGPFSTHFVAGSNPLLLSLSSGGDWISVPGNSLYGTSDFHVMKYEAKCVNLEGVPLYEPTESTYQTYYNFSIPCVLKNKRQISSVKEGYPITRISHDTAKKYCESIGAHLMTNEEYMTIARNIESVPKNWYLGKLYSGHNDNSPASALVASSDRDDYSGTGEAGGTQRRTMSLSNGQVIWDLSGNVWEHVMRTASDIQTPIMTPTCNTGAGWQWCNYGETVSPYVIGWTDDILQSYVGPSDTTHDAEGQNTGRIYTNGAFGGKVLIRGGDWLYGSDAGLFETHLNWSESTMATYVGFRCAR